MTSPHLVRRPQSTAGFQFVSVELDFIFSMLDSARAAANPAQRKQCANEVERSYRDMLRMLPHLHLHENQAAIVKRRVDQVTKSYHALRNSLRAAKGS